MTLLVPMTEAEFAVYNAEAIRDYARQKVTAGQWAEKEALVLSHESMIGLLPQGLQTARHFLYTIRETASGPAIGVLWYAIKAHAGRDSAYVYDISINPEHRRRGHATRAFEALEAEARARGLNGIGLHVFGHNGSAQALYEQIGFQPTSIMMFKGLGFGAQQGSIP